MHGEPIARPESPSTSHGSARIRVFKGAAPCDRGDGLGGSFACPGLTEALRAIANTFGSDGGGAVRSADFSMGRRRRYQQLAPVRPLLHGRSHVPVNLFGLGITGVERYAKVLGGAGLTCEPTGSRGKAVGVAGAPHAFSLTMPILGQEDQD
jgi:hypothetical protein